MTHVALLEFKFRADAEAEAQELLTKLLSQARETAGCENICSYRVAGDTSRVILVETWTSLEANQAYIEWRQTPEGANSLGTLLEVPPRLLHLAPLEIG